MAQLYAAGHRPTRPSVKLYPAMINNDLNLDTYRRQFTQRTRVQIQNFLQPDAAEKLRDCLQHEVPWTLAERSTGTSRTIPAPQYASMTAEERQALLDGSYGAARGRFQFAYDSYMMVKAAQEGRDPGLLLHVVLQFLNSPEFLEFARWFSGEPRIHAVNAQATRYRPGHFLTRHDDEDVQEGRVCAYVINLTPRWDPDWGGLLQFLGPEGGVSETFLPRWNSLSLLRVPQPHSVSLVAPWAGEDRLAITGWWLRR